MMKLLTIIAALALTHTLKAESLLIKLATPASAEFAVQSMIAKGLKATVVSNDWIEVSGNVKASQFAKFINSGSALVVQPNYKVHTYENPAFQKLRQNGQLMKYLQTVAPRLASGADNPALPTGAPAIKLGADPLATNQWGMQDIGLQEALTVNYGVRNVTIAVIDTGVDYLHEDLRQSLWYNSKEVPNNGIDDDKNGYIDDMIGWDFLDNDNKPYDLTGNILQILQGGNPGHGTHCAGNIGATGNNSLGISGVYPRARIMSLRFIGDKGGTTAAAVQAIRYAVDNGAKVLSNSWGSEGEDPSDTTNNAALKEAIQYAQDKGVLFIAAAGNGHQGVGYDNDSDAKPGFPASYANDNIISVAAIDSSDALGKFSNWGIKTVDIGAPGVKVYSTTSDGKYADTLGISIPGLIELPLAGWDGTSMATPHVAGAAALYWSAHPKKTWKEVKAAILASAKPISSLQGKVVSGGKLSVSELMKIK